MDPNERLQKATEQMVSNIARNDLRPMHKRAFLCSANCCDKLKSASHEEFQACVTNCQQAPAHAEKMLSSELQNFQQRIQRCAMDCKDKAEDKLPTDPAQRTPEVMSKLQSEVNLCVNACVDNHVGALKQIEKRFRSSLKSLT